MALSIFTQSRLPVDDAGARPARRLLAALPFVAAMLAGIVSVFLHLDPAAASVVCLPS